MPGIVLGITMVITMEAVKAIGAILLLVLVGYWSYRVRFGGSNEAPELDTSKLKPNNKMMLVGNVGIEEFAGYLADFCKLYNKDKRTVKMELSVLNDGRMVVLFPYDVDFDIFCFAVNYLKYPVSKNDTEVDLLGWGSFGNSKNGLPRSFNANNVMVFVPDDDTNYDVVTILNSSNEALLNSFADGIKKCKTEVKYTAPPFDATQVDSWARERIDIPTGV